MYFFCPVSLFLSASGSGISAFILFLLLRFGASLRVSVVVRMLLLFPCALFSYAMLPLLTGRIRIYESFLERVDKFTATIGVDNLFLSSNAARGTNVGNLVNKILDKNQRFDAIIADSTIISLIQSIGVIGCIFFFLLYFRFMDLSKLEWQVFVACTFPFLLTTVFFEIYPFGFLMLLNLAVLIRNHVQMAAPSIFRDDASDHMSYKERELYV